MFNEKFWLAIAFFAFIALVIKLAKSSIAKSLDDKSKAIAEEILAAKEMKERALKLLASAEKYNSESLNYSQKLIKDAEVEAQKFLAEAQKSVEDEVAKKTTSRKK
jgi:F-type H+-transporting ATPase subunit b